MYFIYDCNNNVVGNPKGYRTHKGAAMQATKFTAPASKALWAAYDARVNKNDRHFSTIYSDNFAHENRTYKTVAA